MKQQRLITYQTIAKSFRPALLLPELWALIVDFTWGSMAWDSVTSAAGAFTFSNGNRTASTTQPKRASWMVLLGSQPLEHCWTVAATNGHRVVSWLMRWTVHPTDPNAFDTPESSPQNQFVWLSCGVAHPDPQKTPRWLSSGSPPNAYCYWSHGRFVDGRQCAPLTSPFDWSTFDPKNPSHVGPSYAGNAAGEREHGIGLAARSVVRVDCDLDAGNVYFAICADRRLNGQANARPEFVPCGLAFDPPLQDLGELVPYLRVSSGFDLHIEQCDTPVDYLTAHVPLTAYPSLLKLNPQTNLKDATGAVAAEIAKAKFGSKIRELIDYGWP